MYRIGNGHDLHRLLNGRTLWLGGVKIPAANGADAHSDGDVLLHAVTDAVLGALALGDIGEFFSPTAPENHDRASAEFLRWAVQEMHARHYTLVNLDTTIHLQRPAVAPFKREIAANLAQLFGAAATQIGVKAKTGEGLGAVGEGLAIAADAIILLRQKETP
jgi:2-C-methyl-D-erythritol 2,4-cyclodiphosphate synthase